MKTEPITRPLPEGWLNANLDYLTTDDPNSIRRGPFGSAIKKAYFVSSGYKVYEQRNAIYNDFDLGDYYITDEKYQELAAFSVAPGDLIMSCSGTIGRIAVVPENALPGVINQALLKLTLNNKVILTKYFMYLFDTMLQQVLRENTRGTAMKNIASVRVLREMDFPLAPLPEQQRIVAEIEKQFTRLDKAVASLKRAQANLARYKASVLKAACNGRLVPQDPDDEPAEILLQRILAERRRQWEEQEWARLVEKAQKKVAQARRKANGRPARLSDLEPEEWQDIPEAEYDPYLPKNEKWKEKYKEPDGVETAELPSLPDGWVWATMGSIADIVSGVTKGRKFGDRETVFLPYIRVANVQQGFLDLSEVKDVEALPEDLEKYRLLKNDLLMTEGGDWDKLGRSAIWKDEVPVCIHQNHIFRARPLLPELPSQWLMIVANSEYGRKYFGGASKQTTNLASINLTQLRAFPVPIPPVAEIERIIEETDCSNSVVEVEVTGLEDSLARAERLRQSILQQAFSGQLVPKEPLGVIT